MLGLLSRRWRIWVTRSACLTSAVHGSVINGLESALVVLLAAVLLRETVTRPAIFAIVVALGGLAVLAGVRAGAGGAVVADVREHLAGADILVVDDGSTDATTARARECRCPRRHAALQPGPRRGAADRLPLRAARGLRLLRPPRRRRPAPARRGGAAAGRGRRRPRRPGDRLALPRRRAIAGSDDYRPTISRRIGISVFRFFLTLATRQRFTDTTSGMRAANRRVMALFSENYSPDFAEIESLQLAVREGLRVEEVPVRMLERAGGSSFLTPLRSAFFIFKG